MSAPDDIEAQVERAMKHWQYGNGGADVRKLLHDALSGKFKEEPLPAIIPPPWPHKEPPRLLKMLGQKFCVAVGDPVDTKSWSSFYGPPCDTALKAINKWNAVFGPLAAAGGKP